MVDLSIADCFIVSGGYTCSPLAKLSSVTGDFNFVSPSIDYVSTTLQIKNEGGNSFSVSCSLVQPPVTIYKGESITCPTPCINATKPVLVDISYCKND